ncbi:MAG: hypothetical protein WC899_07945 [bacterium]|jgi:3D (Asp-Asp-Asp) domain-containing protein
MKKATLLAFVITVVFMGFGFGIDMTAFLAPEFGPEILAVDNQARFVVHPLPPIVREVTAYNVGRRKQTDKTPCIGATGKNLCRLVAQGIKICAANFVGSETILNIEGYGECIVLDRMNRRFDHRVDIAMGTGEVDKALEFGVQRRIVEVKSGIP